MELQAATAERPSDEALMERAWQLHTQPAALDRLEAQLRHDALYDTTLHSLLQDRLAHCWFIAFKYQQPRELLCAFEYDYLVRHTETRTERSDLLQLMQKAHDDALSLRYYGLYGLVQWADREVWGARLFGALLEPYDRVETLLWASRDERLTFDDALLNPPLARHHEWTYFHVQMRRAAFLLMQQLLRKLDAVYRERGAQDFELRGALIDLALLVAAHWRTLMWRDERGSLVALEAMQLQSGDSLNARVPQFFALPLAFDERVDEALFALDVAHIVDGWHRLTSSVWTRVKRELPQSGERLFLPALLDAKLDRACVVPPGAFDFIYDAASPKARAAFHARVLDQ